MITELRYDDGSGGHTLYSSDGWVILYSSDGWVISLQSEPLGVHECYVAYHRDNGTTITISARVVLFIREQEPTAKAATP